MLKRRYARAEKLRLRGSTVMAEPSLSDDTQVGAGTAPAPERRRCLWPDERSIRAQTLFREIPLFRDVPPHHLRQIAQFSHTHTFDAGETIIRMGEVGDTMYVISSGKVEVVLERPSGNVVVATFGPGEVFGELSIFDSERRSATVVAVEETEALTLDRMDVLRLLNRSPDMAMSLLKSLSARLRIANDRLVGQPPEAPKG